MTYRCPATSTCLDILVIPRNAPAVPAPRASHATSHRCGPTGKAPQPRTRPLPDWTEVLLGRILGRHALSGGEAHVDVWSEHGGGVCTDCATRVCLNRCLVHCDMSDTFFRRCGRRRYASLIMIELPPAPATGRMLARVGRAADGGPGGARGRVWGGGSHHWGDLQSRTRQGCCSATDASGGGADAGPRYAADVSTGTGLRAPGASSRRSWGCRR